MTKKTYFVGYLVFLSISFIILFAVDYVTLFKVYSRNINY